MFPGILSDSSARLGRIASLSIVAAIILAACDTTTPAPTPTPTPTTTSTATAIPPATPANTPLPTHTLVSPTATVAPSPAPTPLFSVVEFVTEDDVTLRGRLFGRGSTAVVFSHMVAGSQTDWETIAREVADLGYLVLTFDFRGHGASAGTYDPAKSPDDLWAATAFVRERGAADVALVGASLGGMAIAGVAALSTPVAVVIISAPLQFGDLVVGDADLTAITAPALFIATENDWALSGTLHMFAVVQGPKEKQLYPGNAHGTDILASEHGDAMKRRILEFLKANLPAD